MKLNQHLISDSLKKDKILANNRKKINLKTV